MEHEPSIRTRGQIALSRLVGWLADRRVPGALRAPAYKCYAKLTGADLAEMRGELRDHASLGAFFVRRLRQGVRTIDPDPRRLPSPVDGTIQAASRVEAMAVVEAKGRTYPVRDLLAGVGDDVALEGGHAWTIYLGPKDYHRIHSPLDARLVEARHVVGRRFSVQPRILEKRAVLATNERVVLRLESEGGPLLMVLVGALIVGRIRVVGIERFGEGRLAEPRRFARGEEIARFEMGSTVVLIAPPGAATPLERPATGDSVRLGEALAVWHR